MSWEPFVLAEAGTHAPPPRAIDSSEGIGDRLRAVAFAELQAKKAFLWAVEQFEDASEDLRQAWRMLAKAEDKHLNWLLSRMEELQISIQERPVSTRLWESLTTAQTAKEFALYMASAEDRGRQAGERFEREISKIDPVTGKLFGQIALEEREHVALAERFFPEDWKQKRS